MWDFVSIEWKWAKGEEEFKLGGSFERKIKIKWATVAYHIQNPKQ